MATKRNRTGYILIGIFIGLLTGISVMWWQSSFNKQSWFSFDSLSNLAKTLYSSTDEFFTNIKTTFVHEKSGSQKKIITQSADTLTDTSLIDSLGSSDSLGYNTWAGSNGLDYYIDADNLPDSLLWYGPKSRVYPVNDSLGQDTSLYKSNSITGENIRVKRDELLLLRFIKVNGLNDTTASHDVYLDSLLTNDKLSKRLPANYYRVEFWRSPINYSGYKCIRNRIIIFGVYEPDNVTLEFINRKLYLRNQNNYYLLEPTENFKALVSIRKPEVSGKNKLI